MEKVTTLWARIKALIFQRIKATERLADLRYEAEKQYIEHQTAADHHQALSTMYLRRMQWCDNYLDNQEPQQLRRAA